MPRRHGASKKRTHTKAFSTKKWARQTAAIREEKEVARRMRRRSSRVTATTFEESDGEAR